MWGGRPRRRQRRAARRRANAVAPRRPRRRRGLRARILARGATDVRPAARLLLSTDIVKHVQGCSREALRELSGLGVIPVVVGLLKPESAPVVAATSLLMLCGSSEDACVCARNAGALPILLRATKREGSGVALPFYTAMTVIARADAGCRDDLIEGGAVAPIVRSIAASDPSVASEGAKGLARMLTGNVGARARADAAAAGAVGVLCRLVAGVLKQAGRGDAAAVSMLVTTDFRSKPSLVGALESLASLTGQQDSCGASCAAAAAAEGAVAMSLGVRRFERVYGDIFFYTAVLLAAVVKNDPRGVARAGAREAGAFALIARAITARQDDPNMAGALCHALSAVIGTCPEHLAGMDMAQASCAIPALVRLLGCDEWEARATASTVLMRVTCGPPRSPAAANGARAASGRSSAH